MLFFSFKESDEHLKSVFVTEQAHLHKREKFISNYLEPKFIVQGIEIIPVSLKINLGFDFSETHSIYFQRFQSFHFKSHHTLGEVGISDLNKNHYILSLSQNVRSLSQIMQMFLITEDLELSLRCVQEIFLTLCIT